MVYQKCFQIIFTQHQHPVFVCLQCLSVWFSSSLAGETVSQICVYPLFYCPQKHNKNSAAESKGKPRGYSCSCRRRDFVGGVWICLWESGTWKLAVRKEPTDNRSFSAAVYQGDADSCRRWFNGWLLELMGDSSFLKRDSRSGTC